jgi:hypothetical protein
MKVMISTCFDAASLLIVGSSLDKESFDSDFFDHQAGLCNYLPFLVILVRNF